MPAWGSSDGLSVFREGEFLMHKDDSMTPKARMAACLRGEPVDRIPANLFCPPSALSWRD